MRVLSGIYRFVTAPIRGIRAVARVPREFRERIFVKGRGSDTGHISPS